MNRPVHLCRSPACDCGFTRRDWLRFSALATAAGAAPLLRAGDARAQADKGDDQPVRIGYLPITDATPLLVAHGRGLFEAEGLMVEKPRLFRSWAQVVEAFVGGQVNVIHLLSPSTLWVRYGTRFPAKVTAWNHVNGSALTVASGIDDIGDLGGQVVAIPFWYSIHNILLQKLVRDAGMKVVYRPRSAGLARDEVNLVVMPPAEMVSALASKAIAGYIVAEPFNAAAELNGVGKILRFSGDVWKDHACCVILLAERDTTERPEWSQRVNNAIVKAQLWSRGNLVEAGRLLASDGSNRYTPHPQKTLDKVLVNADGAAYERAGLIRNPGWHQRRIDFQPYPYPSYTEALVSALRETHVEGDAGFLKTLDPAFAARDLVDARFVTRAIEAVGGPAVFDLPAGLERQEVISR